MAAWPAAIAVIVSALIASGLTYISTRRTAGYGDLQARYDQMQEDVNTERSARVAEVSAERLARVAERNEFRMEITGLRVEMVGLRSEVRARDDYIGLLRRHIGDSLPPPPPPYPPQLTGGS